MTGFCEIDSMFTAPFEMYLLNLIHLNFRPYGVNVFFFQIFVKLSGYLNDDNNWARILKSEYTKCFHCYGQKGFLFSLPFRSG